MLTISDYRPNLYSNGDLYSNITKKLYTGYYYELNNGKKYAGRYPLDNNIKEELVTDIYFPEGQREEIDTESEIGLKVNFKRLYNFITSNTYNRIYQAPISDSIRPNGPGTNYIRTFFQRLSDNKIIETGVQMSGKQPNFSLYRSIVLDWEYRGRSRNEIYAVNRNRVLLKQQKQNIPNFYSYFNENFDLNYQYRDFDLYTSGNQLSYLDGRNFVGKYHIHPKLGPMEGAFHKEENHQRLIFNKVQEKNPITNLISRDNLLLDLNNNIYRGRFNINTKGEIKSGMKESDFSINLKINPAYPENKIPQLIKTYVNTNAIHNTNNMYVSEPENISLIYSDVNKEFTQYSENYERNLNIVDREDGNFINLPGAVLD